MDWVSFGNLLFISAGGDPVPVKFGPKGSDPPPNRKDARSTFHTRRAVQSAIAELLAIIVKHNAMFSHKNLLRT